MSRKIRVKPGKGQSMAGLCVGVLFCLIGLFVVIPSFGLFGIFWTLMAVIITVTNAVNAFSQKGISTHEIIVDENDQEDIENRLKAAKKLYEEGIITKEEYESKHKEILKDL